MQTVQVMICAFHAIGGWRVKKMATAVSEKIQVVVIGGKKLLQIPTIGVAKAGRFCNPRRLALEYVRAKVTGVPPERPVIRVNAVLPPIQISLEKNLAAIAADIARIWGIGPYNKQMKDDHNVAC